MRTLFCLSTLIFFLSINACTHNEQTAPILILATNRDFGSYTAEILKTEGFNEFEVDSVEGKKFNSSFVSQFNLVIVAESKIDRGNIDILKQYVKKGGRLISVNPGSWFQELFGIVPTGESIADGFIQVDTTSAQGKGLTTKFLRFHGKADCYALTGATSISTFSVRKTQEEGFPAVVSNNYGKGRTIAFLYNLPRNIVLSRQGNPLSAGIEKDSIPGLRGMDLFTDDWVDSSDNTINKTDEQMSLLSHCIENLLSDEKIIPRFWYFPDTLKCLVTLTNDGEYKSEKDFEPQFRDVDSMEAKMSLYILGVDKVSKAWVERWTARGFEIAGHPDDTREAGNPTWIRMDSVIKSRKNEIISNYGLPVRTNVNHWFVWCGRDSSGRQEFAAEARLEEKNGIEMDVNYAHYDMNSNQGDHYLGPLGTKQGNFTGSGLVMKFADSKGKIINVYQHLNAVYDQEYNESHDPEGFYNCFKGLMDRSLHNDVYSFISVKSHNDEYYFSKQPLMRMLAYARQQHIPVWTEMKLLDFIKMKDEASFSSLNVTDHKLTFDVISSLKNTDNLTFMVPMEFKDLTMKGITIDGKDSGYISRVVKGSYYALVSIEPGMNHSVIVNY